MRSSLFCLLILHFLAEPAHSREKQISDRDSRCNVYIATHYSGFPPFRLFNCLIQGNLLIGGSQLFGHFVVDLRDLTSGVSFFDRVMKESYLNLEKYRYASLSLYPYKLGAREFKAWFRFNGVSMPIRGEVTGSSKKHFDAHFSVNLEDFKIYRGWGWEFVKTKVVIHARVFINEFTR